MFQLFYPDFKGLVGAVINGFQKNNSSAGLENKNDSLKKKNKKLSARVRSMK